MTDDQDSKKRGIEILKGLLGRGGNPEPQPKGDDAKDSKRD